MPLASGISVSLDKDEAETTTCLGRLPNDLVVNAYYAHLYFLSLSSCTPQIGASILGVGSGDFIR